MVVDIMALCSSTPVVRTQHLLGSGVGMVHKLLDRVALKESEVCTTILEGPSEVALGCAAACACTCYQDAQHCPPKQKFVIRLRPHEGYV